MDDINWVRVAVTSAMTVAVIYYGRWTQRRDDRKARERAQVRRTAEVLAQQTLRNRPRGGNQ